MKKFLVLGILFALPITAYLFFASGKNNFAKLPVLTENVKDISGLEHTGDSTITFKDHINIVAFFGDDLEKIKGNTFNLDQKILEKYYSFNDFQFVIVLPDSIREDASQYVEEFKSITESAQWKLVFGSKEEIQSIFESFDTPFRLNERLYTPHVFIVDKNMNLRGRDDDEDEEELYGYNSTSVAELSNKMNDDVKVILAEYRLALKKNNKESTTE